jgi:parallel beta-helix repeat protein
MTTAWFFRRNDSRLMTASRRARTRARNRSRRPAIESLETRVVLSGAVYTVTSLADSGAGSLRDAITQANALTPGTAATIDFSIGTGAQTIELSSALPMLANPITIDGTTQPGYAGRPLIQVDGQNAGAGAYGFALDDDAPNSVIKGLEITGFNAGGIYLNNGNGDVFTNDIIGLHYNGTLPRVAANGTFGIELTNQSNGITISHVVVAGNQYNGIVLNNSMNDTVTASDIGTDLSGEDSLDRNAVALGNGVSGGGGSGIVINGGANHNTISNNVIVNNQSYGVYISDFGTSANVLTGNHIGIDLAGTTALGNGGDGVALVSGANSNFIGQAGNGNLISGNGVYGVFLNGADSAGDHTSFNVLAGNLIGTNAAGNAAVPNAINGVVVNGGAIANYIGALVTGTGTVTQTGGNVISGNTEWGIYISDSGTNSNVVRNDYIGTDITGKLAVANRFNGVDIVSSAASNTVGGTTTAARNVISGNANEGVLIGLGATMNVVEGNFIGTDATGAAPLPNVLDGVYVGLGAVNNTIGGQNPTGALTTAAWNVISGNFQSGIKVADSGTSGNTICGNFIGTDVTSEFAVPNHANGITIGAGTSSTTVGAETSGSGNLNVIAGNSGDGLSITSSSGNNVSFDYFGVDLNNNMTLPNRGNGVAIHGASGNRVNISVIRNNGGYGILADTGSTYNAWYYDSIFGNALGGIAQPGNPNFQPAPVLFSATAASGTTTVVGSITNSPDKSASLVVMFYASPAPISPAAVQGLTFIGQATVTTDAYGNASFTATLNQAVPGGQIVTATADYNVSNTSNFSNFVTVPGAPSATATFVGTDTTDQGNWRSAFGADGYDIAGDTSATNPSLPSYATLALSGAQTFIWAKTTTDSRALQNAANNGRIASTFYSSTAMSFDLNLTDGKTHEVSFYALDWDKVGRTETVQVVDAATGSVLDTENLSSFQNGKYLTWNLSGHVHINITNTGPYNAVVGGLFFGGKPAVTATATFVSADTTTQGNWRTAYGANGYDIEGDTSAKNPNLPSYATLGVTGASLFTWAASTTDVRALQNAANTGRLATTWYTAGTMTFNLNLTDGKVHRVSLYAVDWDTTSRGEQVQVVDAATGMVLDTRTISSFHGGEYLTWDLSGNVLIKVTKTSGANAVVSGFFFE